MREPSCLQYRFGTHAKATPDRTAVVFGDTRLTYRELNARSNRLARRLRAAGVGRETLVGLYCERSLEMVVGVLAILKAGGAYLPLDVAYPTDRLAFILSDADAPVLLTQKDLPIPRTTATRIDLDDDPTLDSSDLDDEAAASPDDLAYVIYTSGSTGKPKGVPVTHRNVSRLFDSTDAWFHFGPDDVWTLFHSHAFDFSVWEIWGALLYGGRLVVVPYAVSRSPEAFFDLLRREQVTVLNQTPSAFRQLIPVARGEHALRYVIFGGEALDTRSLAPWFERYGDANPTLVNMYGITETTVHVTYRPLRSADVGGPSVIGVPIPDLTLHVWDVDGNPVAVGAVGELVVGGAGVARGYLNRPELTAERFVTIDGARFYKSGDLARRLPDGDLEYIGRADLQVKIRGHRIELGEIEAALAAHPRIADAVVAARGTDDAKRLVAYVIAESDLPEQVEMAAFLRARLPAYMIPAAYVRVEAFPLTANGKLDRAALPEPVADARAGDIRLDNPTEETIAAAWRAVLETASVGPDDNFFDIGGDSVRLVTVHAELRRTWPNLAVVSLFEHATIRSLARFLEPAASPATTSETNSPQDRARRQREAAAAAAAARMRGRPGKGG